jgi:hypothetical protein
MQQLSGNWGRSRFLRGMEDSSVVQEGKHFVICSAWGERQGHRLPCPPGSWQRAEAVTGHGRGWGVVSIREHCWVGPGNPLGLHLISVAIKGFWT